MRRRCPSARAASTAASASAASASSAAASARAAGRAAPEHAARILLIMQPPPPCIEQAMYTALIQPLLPGIEQAMYIAHRSTARNKPAMPGRQQTIRAPPEHCPTRSEIAIRRRSSSRLLHELEPLLPPISTASRLHLDCISTVSRLHLDCISAISRACCSSSSLSRRTRSRSASVSARSRAISARCRAWRRERAERWCRITTCHRARVLPLWRDQDTPPRDLERDLPQPRDVLEPT